MFAFEKQRAANDKNFSPGKKKKKEEVYAKVTMSNKNFAKLSKSKVTSNKDTYSSSGSGCKC